jgi:hypothetical protein
MIFTPHYITTYLSNTSKQGPPLTHQATLLVQIHTLASLIKFKLENSKSQFYLQGKVKVQLAPATLAVNGHGFMVKFSWLDSHLNILQPALSSQPPPPSHTRPHHRLRSKPYLHWPEFNVTYKARPGTSQLQPPWPLTAMVLLKTFIHEIYTSIHFNQPNQHLQARPPPHIPGHIIDSEPHLSFLDKN